MFDYCSTATDDVRSLSREIGFIILARLLSGTEERYVQSKEALQYIFDHICK